MKYFPNRSNIIFSCGLSITVLALNYTTLAAQLTLTDSLNIPLIGESYEIKRTDTVPDTIIRNWIGKTGANQVWDLRNIATNETRDYHWLPPSRGARFSDFPNANLLEYDSISGREHYYSSYNGKHEKVGIFDPSRYFLSYVNDPFSILRFPMSQNSVFQDTAIGHMQYLNSSHTDNTFMIRTALIDAQGSLIMPDSTVIDSVVRLRSITMILDGTVSSHWRSTDTVFSWYSPQHRQYYARFYVVNAGISYRASGFEYQSNYSYTRINFSADNVEIEPAELKIYPQPANSSFFIEKQQGKLAEIELYNLDGKLIKSIELTNKIQKVDCSSLAPGMYWLKQKDDIGLRIQKLIIGP